MKRVYILEANTSKGLEDEVNWVLDNHPVEIEDVRYQTTWNKGDNEMSYSALVFVKEFTWGDDGEE